MISEPELDGTLLIEQLEEKLNLPECESAHVDPQPPCSIQVTALASHTCDGFSAKVCQNMADYVEIQRILPGCYCPACFRPCGECWRVTPIN